MKSPNVAQIVKIGLNYPEIGTQEIQELFGVSRTVACFLKKKVKAKMAEQNIYTWNPHNINTKIAFDVWGLDIDGAERVYKRLQKLEINV